MNTKNETLQFIWRICYSHFIAYFIAGVFALLLLDYKEMYATAELSLLMRPVSDPIVALGPFLQLFRGIIIALVLLPIRKVIIEGKQGYLILGLLVLGLSLLSTIGPTFGSFDGYIYTIIPALYQVLGYFEALVYIFLFVFILWLSYRYEKRLVQLLFLIAVLILSFFSIMGFFMAKGAV